MLSCPVFRGLSAPGGFPIFPLQSKHKRHSASTAKHIPAENKQQPSTIFLMPGKWGIPFIFLVIPCIYMTSPYCSYMHVKITKAPSASSQTSKNKAL